MLLVGVVALDELPRERPIPASASQRISGCPGKCLCSPELGAGDHFAIKDSIKLIP